jgi:hypothetical protein
LVIGEGFGWDAVAQAAVESSPVVEYLDVTGDGDANVCSGGECFAVVYLVLQSGKE